MTTSIRYLVAKSYTNATPAVSKLCDGSEAAFVYRLWKKDVRNRHVGIYLLHLRQDFIQELNPEEVDDLLNAWPE